MGPKNPKNPKPGSPGPARPPQQEQRIRWERDDEKDGQIVVRDSATGKVIAVVRNLFDFWKP